MNYRIPLSMAFIVLTIIASGAVAPINADEGDPFDLFDLVDESGLLSSVDSSHGQSTASETIYNPWGCADKSHWPHESTRDPGPGYIQAKSETDCDVAPPPYAVWGISQTLYRSSWRGWIQVHTAHSTCPDTTGSPDCKAAFMRAYINWRCTPGTSYNYRVKATHTLTVDGRTYSEVSDAKNAQYWQRGRIECPP